MLSTKRNFLTSIILTTITLIVLFGLQTPAKAQSVASPLTIQPNSPLIPDDIGAEETFRLIFVTSTKHAASATDISNYNTLVQTAANNNSAFKSDAVDSATITNIKAVGSTSTTDARNNTDMWNTTTATWQDANNNVPIYWVGGNRVADSYADFYDGSWKLLQQNLPRNESGERLPSERIYVWTGSNDDGTKDNTNPLGANQVLWGAVGLVTGTDINPIGNTSGFNTDANTIKNHLYGITPVFQVEKTGISFDTSASASVGEGDDKKVTIQLTAPAREVVTVTINTADGTATAPADYTAGPYQITFAKGEQSKTFTVATAGDNIDEDVEVFGLSIQTDNFPNWLHLLSADGLAVFIQEKVEIAIAPANNATEVTEGREAQFTITADQAPDLDLPVAYRITDGPGHDYTADDQTGVFTATIPKGQTTTTIRVRTQNDGIDRPAAAGSGQVTATINPHHNGVYTLGSTSSVSLPIHDKQATSVSITPIIGGNPGFLVEGGVYQFNLELGRELVAPEKLTIPFTFGGTAAYSTDYKLLCPTFKNLKNMTATCNGFNGNSPSITFTGGAATGDTGSVAIEMHDFLQVLTDTVAETTPETITITLNIDATSGTNLHGGAQGATYSSTIQDPPAASVIQFSQSTSSINEGAGPLEATVAISAPLGSNLTLPITITENGATRGTDFTLANNGILIKAGESVASFSVDIPDDTTAEANEQFTITIDTNQLPNSPTAITAGTNTATTVTIIDDDPLEITLDASRKIIPEGVENQTITLTLNRPLQTGETLTVPLTIAGNATQGTDYTLAETATTGVTYTGVGTASMAVSFAPSQATTATFTLSVPDDGTQETIAERLTITAGNPSFTKANTANPDPIVQGSPLNLHLFDPSEHVQWLILTDQGIDSHRDFYIGEGDTGTLQVSLKEAPTANVTAQVAVNSGSSHATISSSSLTFTATDYQNKKISVLGTQDTATSELDTVVVRFTLTSTDTRYNNKTYDQTIKVVDNDTPITVRFTNATSIDAPEGNQVYRVYFTTNRRVPIRIPKQALLLSFTTTAGEFTAISGDDDPQPANYDIEWTASGIAPGENQGHFQFSAKDDDIVEQDATATATLSLADTSLNITADTDHNTLTIVHTDDDALLFSIKQKQTVYYLIANKERSFPFIVEPQAKTGTNPQTFTMTGDSTEIAIPDIDTLKAIVLRTPDGFYITRDRWYSQSILQQTEPPIVVLAHGDTVPTTFETKPEISISGGNSVVEGSNAVFTLTSTPAPAVNLTVNVAVTQSGSYGVTTGSQTVTIPTSGSTTFSVSTAGDNVDEADGSVTVTLAAGSDYTISSTQGTATVTVTDDDDPATPATPITPKDNNNQPIATQKPEVSISAGSDIDEGDTAVFTLTSTPTPTANLIINIAVTQNGSYGIPTGSRTITIPTSGETTFSITTTEDNEDERDGSVTVTITSGSDYIISSTQSAETILIADDDEPAARERIPLSVISITSNSATAVWSTLPNADQYMVRWRQTGTQSGTVQYQIVDTNYKKIDGLAPQTEYTIEVVAEINSVWQEVQKSPSITFTTLSQ